jgi:hypothetical protein
MLTIAWAGDLPWRQRLIPRRHLGCVEIAGD